MCSADMLMPASRASPACPQGSAQPAQPTGDTSVGCFHNKLQQNPPASQPRSLF